MKFWTQLKCYSKIQKKMSGGRNVLNFNVKCFQDNGSFLHPAKKADAHQLSKTKKKKKKKKKTQPKLAWKKKNRKTDGQRMQKKKKNETSGQNSIAYCWHNSNLHMRQMSFVGKIDHLQDLPTWFRMANNIACCCASMATRILLTPLVDLVTGCVRTKWLTWNHCEEKKKKKGEEGYRFVSNFVNRFVLLPFFFSKKKTKQTGCIIMYLHFASRLSGKFTLDVCISK